MADCLTADQDDWLLRLYIQPKASLDAWVGIHGDELKVSITAPPIDGKANAYLQKWLAKQFKVAKSQVIIESGAQGRHKRVRIQQGQLPDPLRSFLPEDPLCVI